MYWSRSALQTQDIFIPLLVVANSVGTGSKKSRPDPGRGQKNVTPTRAGFTNFHPYPDPDREPRPGPPTGVTIFSWIHGLRVKKTVLATSRNDFKLEKGKKTCFAAFLSKTQETTRISSNKWGTIAHWLKIWKIHWKKQQVMEFLKKNPVTLPHARLFHEWMNDS